MKYQYPKYFHGKYQKATPTLQVYLPYISDIFATKCEIQFSNVLVHYWQDVQVHI